MRTALITQSNFLPWPGYLHVLASVDEIVMLDDVQYTKRDWRSRNRFLFPEPEWFSVPVKRPNGRESAIDEVEIADLRTLHQLNSKLLQHNLKSRHYQKLEEVFARANDEICRNRKLSRLNLCLIEAALPTSPAVNRIHSSRILRDRNTVSDLITELQRSHPQEDGSKTKTAPSIALAAMTAALDCDTYITGPAAFAYLDPSPFLDLGLSVASPRYNMDLYLTAHPEVPLSWIETVLKQGWARLDEILASKLDFLAANLKNLPDTPLTKS